MRPELGADGRTLPRQLDHRIGGGEVALVNRFEEPIEYGLAVGLDPVAADQAGSEPMKRKPVVLLLGTIKIPPRFLAPGVD